MREIYALDDERLLLVASDRVSTFDVVLPTPIPDKGRVLTGLSASGSRERARSCRTICSRSATTDARSSVDGWRCFRSSASSAATWRARAGRTTGRPERCVGTSCQPACGSRSGYPSPSSPPRRRRPKGTTRTSPRTRPPRLRPDLYEQAKEASLALYAFASAHAQARGIVLADTKFELGIAPDGALVLGDEALTPDSSRFWPLEGYEPGRGQPSFDKQFVRDWCERTGWDKTPPGPELPDDVGGDARPLRGGVRAAHRHVVRALSGEHRERPRMKATVLVRPKQGILDPQGEAVRDRCRSSASTSAACGSVV